MVPEHILLSLSFITPSINSACPSLFFFFLQFFFLFQQSFSLILASCLSLSLRLFLLPSVRLSLSHSLSHFSFSVIFNSFTLSPAYPSFSLASFHLSFHGSFICCLSHFISLSLFLLYHTFFSSLRLSLFFVQSLLFYQSFIFLSLHPSMLHLSPVLYLTFLQEFFISFHILCVSTFSHSLSFFPSFISLSLYPSDILSSFFSLFGYGIYFFVTASLGDPFLSLKILLDFFLLSSVFFYFLYSSLTFSFITCILSLTLQQVPFSRSCLYFSFITQTSFSLSLFKFILSFHLLFLNSSIFLASFVLVPCIYLITQLLTFGFIFSTLLKFLPLSF